jgi:hypothetical protein
MRKLVFFALFSLPFILGDCNKEDSNSQYLENADCSAVDVSNNTYTKSIKSILDKSCATSGCHDAKSKEDGIDLSTYSSSKSAFENSDCLCSIHHGSGCDPMPRGSAKLSDATIQLIDCWVKNGYSE